MKRARRGIATKPWKIYNRSMGKRKKDEDDLSGFQDFNLVHGRRDPKAVKAEDVTSLAISKRGRITVPSFIKAKYKYKGKSFVAKHRGNDELLIQFLVEKNSQSKQVQFYGDTETTMYIEVGPQIRALGRVIKESSSLKFEDVKGKNALILDLSDLPTL